MIIQKGMIITHKLTGAKCEVVDRINSHNYVIRRNDKYIPVSYNTIRFSYDVPKDRSVSVLWLLVIIVLSGFMVWYHNSF